MSLKKLNIGCGNRIKRGYDNLDVLNIPNIKYPLTDARELPVKDNTYDEIFSQWVLEHFAENEIVSLLQEWKRVLRPNGKMEVITNNQEAINNGLLNEELTWDEWVWLTYGADTKNYGGCHKVAFTKDSIVKYLDRVNFSDYSIKVTTKVKGEQGELKCPGIIITAIK